MNDVLVVNYGEFEFTNFNRAIQVLSEEYGFEGLAWDLIVASGDFDVLADFLMDAGFHAEIN